ncbi:MAG: autotransporter domain-containing SGNH/GDSL hydrolase family protein [Candidatus Pelagadaptatus aseana]|uniref:autotransporter domain-containing protein n=1 Tax=Candidatus Pelagadaptatus aseana TaxID=3120508 RepID=UPI0039B26B09
MRRKALVAAMALATSMSVQSEQPFNDLIVFGDSLLDNGNLSYATNAGGVIASELFAESLGFDLETLANGGSNYAVGGYQTTDILDSIAGGVADQDAANTVTTGGGNFNPYLFDNPRANPNALYLIDGGGNDLAGSWLGGGAAAVQASAQNTVAAVTALNAAGAKYIMVATVPDLGFIPQIQLAELGAPGTVAAASQASLGYNDALALFMPSSGANVIPVDFAGLVNLIVREADSLGFASGFDAAVAGGTFDQAYTCYDNGQAGTGASATCYEHEIYGIDGSAPDPDRLIFNDALHPTGKTHALASDYLLDIILAPQKVGLLPQMGLDAARGQIQTVQSEMRQSRWGGVQNGWFVSGAVANSEQEGNVSPELDNYSATVGLIHRFSDKELFGVALTTGYNELDVSGADFEANSYGLNVLYGYRAGSWFVDGTIGITTMDYSDLQRDFVFGTQTYTAEGDTTGLAMSLDVLAGYDLLGDSAKYNFGPIVGVQTIHSKVSSYRETGGEISNYEWADQTANSNQFRIGLMANARMSERLTLNAEVFHSTEEEEEGFRDVEVTNTNLGFRSYELPGAYVDGSDFVTANISGSYKLSAGEVRMNYHYSGQADESGRFSVTYSAAF